MLNFANAKAYNGGLIEENSLCLVKLEVRELKKSQADNIFISVIARVFNGKWEGRVVFAQVMLTSNGGSEPSSVGYSQVKAILECNGKTVASTPEAFQFETFEQVAAALHGALAGIRVGIETDQETKKKTNRISLFLSPDPSSGTADLWDEMLAAMDAPKGGHAVQIA